MGIEDVSFLASFKVAAPDSIFIAFSTEKAVDRVKLTEAKLKCETLDWTV